MIVRGEPPTLALRAAGSVGFAVRNTTRLFNATLDLRDTRDVAQPYLAEALPQLNADSWRVFPDGRMELTYRLKPNLTWHDGTPLTADDFAFAWAVHARSDTRFASSVPPNLVEDVVAPDPRTVVVRWKVPYPEAGGLNDTFQALPRHILGQVFDEEAAETFRNQRFWSAEYVGAGPYKLERWEPGAFIEAVAFDAHVGGRPKIDRVIVRFIEDESTVLANVLSEAAHVVADQAIRFEGATELKKQWGTSNKGGILLTPGQLRFTLLQHRPEYINPRALSDVRVRRALAHSHDRQAINDGLFDGLVPGIETLVPPSVPYFADLDRAIPKYPYDPRRTEQLLTEAGLVRGSDGLWSGPGGERFVPQLAIQSGGINERQAALQADAWRRSGIETTIETFPPARAGDFEFRATFPAMQSTAYPARWQQQFHYLSSAEIGSPQNRWVGFNRGGWSNAEYDRLSEAYNTTLDANERTRQAIQMERLRAEDMAVLPLYFNPSAAVHLAAVQGPDANLASEELLTVNITAWELR
jgi:peptide/nickel transport system substrate-binding protein